MLALVAAVLVAAFDTSLTSGDVTKQRLFGFALFACDNEIPLAEFAVSRIESLGHAPFFLFRKWFRTDSVASRIYNQPAF